MANHKSAEKRARQTIKKTERNRATKARVRTAIRKVKEAASKDEAVKALPAAYKQVQKAKSVLHKNAIRRKMSRIAKSANRKQAS